MAYKRGVMANCIICGKEFEKKSSNAITCSEECSREKNRRRVKQRDKEKAKQRRIEREVELKQLMSKLGGEWKEVSTIEGYEEYNGFWVGSVGKVIGRMGDILTERYQMSGEYKLVFVRMNEKSYQVDQLVAKAFVEGRTEERTDVDHKDQDPTNNKAENLRWVTKKENCANRDNKTIGEKAIATIRKNEERYQKGNLPNEIWRDVGELIIEGEQKYISGRYFISNMGRLKDEEMKTITYGGERKIDSNRDSNCKTYHFVNLRGKDGSKISGQPMHRLVALAFVEGYTKKKCHVNHKEGNSNEASNLEWVTPADNVREAYKTGENKSGEKLGISVVQLTLEGEKVREWKSACEAEREEGYSQRHITSCCKGRRNTHAGFIWVYKVDYEEGKVPQLTDTQKKKAIKISNAISGNNYGTKSIANAKYLTNEFKIAVEMRKNGEWNAKACAEYAGYKSVATFCRGIKRAIELEIITDKYEDIVC